MWDKVQFYRILVILYFMKKTLHHIVLFITKNLNNFHFDVYLKSNKNYLIILIYGVMAMKKLTIIYWSNGGNVEVLANHIAKGAKEAGAAVLVKLVSEATVEDVTNADAVAFGSPSMDNNRIEQQEMQPFMDKFKLLPVGNKTTGLFGSYGWDNGEFMNKWTTLMKDYQFNVIKSLTVNEAPTNEQLAQAEEMGKSLVK
jgi:flavodoxin short chain